MRLCCHGAWSHWGRQGFLAGILDSPSWRSSLLYINVKVRDICKIFTNSVFQKFTNQIAIVANGSEFRVMGYTNSPDRKYSNWAPIPRFGRSILPHSHYLWIWFHGLLGEIGIQTILFQNEDESRKYALRFDSTRRYVPHTNQKDCQSSNRRQTDHPIWNIKIAPRLKSFSFFFSFFYFFQFFNFWSEKNMNSLLPNFHTITWKLAKKSFLW